MTQTVWHVNEVRNLAMGGVQLAPSADFALGIIWLANQQGAGIPVPVSVKRSGPPEAQLIEVTL